MSIRNSDATDFDSIVGHWSEGTKMRSPLQEKSCLQISRSLLEDARRRTQEAVHAFASDLVLNLDKFGISEWGFLYETKRLKLLALGDSFVPLNLLTRQISDFLPSR
jgi:hypothetical protein